MTDLIAEVGINHLGDADKLSRMVKKASAIGLKHLKFQYRSKNPEFFHNELEMGATLVSQELETATLDREVIRGACQQARELGLSAGVSFFRLADLRSFCELTVPDFIKIPSAEALNVELVQSAQEYGVPVMISTGGLSWQQIKILSRTIVFRPEDCVFYCVANYPAALGSTYPSMIPGYREMFPCRIGYSSHDRDWEINIAFLQAGIDVLERHLCESKEDSGLDISTSSDYAEMSKLNTFCLNTLWRANVPITDKVPNQGEVQNVKDLGSGYYYDRDYVSGELVVVSNLDVRSPCRGVRVGATRDFNVTRDVRSGHPVIDRDMVGVEAAVRSDGARLRDNRVSLPVRFHDYRRILAHFPLRNYEFHMSYKDVERADEWRDELLSAVDDSLELSIHLPDYISSTNLIDPLSGIDSVRRQSLELIDRCTELARTFEELTSRRCPVVGSFSVLGEHGRSTFYSRIAEFFSDTYAAQGVAIMPQLLPRKAWYFGGSCRLDAFCSISDIEYFAQMPHGICLDTAHCIMAANSAGENAADWIHQLLPLAGHIHLSDASGEDGEGVVFGQGELSAEITTVLKHSAVKVIEQWEGHLNDFMGFELALRYIERHL